MSVASHRRNLVFSGFPTKVDIDTKLRPTESSFAIDAPIRALESFRVKTERVRDSILLSNSCWKYVSPHRALVSLLPHRCIGFAYINLGLLV